MSRWDDLDNSPGPTDAELRASDKRGAQVARENRRRAFLNAKAAQGQLTPAETRELDELIRARYRP